ncbi:asparagine synthase C-terminal domain-containing protein [Streptomyces sp. NPDC058011]|uniref:asparagine synthase C-terminal domain-containing protein n=1 Tax=Streptomyces sp. NPDC058011 TaxID=3346305 RepID=UPI0036E81F3B
MSRSWVRTPCRPGWCRSWTGCSGRTNLQRCDRTTMAYGLKARVPFLDRDVIELALSIPPDKMTARGVEEKKLLRDAFAGWLPEEILRLAASSSSAMDPGPRTS